ncbi:hypothetical protein AYR61_14815 (plasmid) [Secundilactobacillus paracollinoides]|nr:hypothetical protein AYR61_14815 [Secundilactobacillus paracollinoides]
MINKAFSRLLILQFVRCDVCHFMKHVSLEKDSEEDPRSLWKSQIKFLYLCLEANHFNQSDSLITVKMLVDCKINPTLFGQKRSASLKMVFTTNTSFRS